MFIGREREMELLEELFGKRTPSLVVCRGRRRIGKSRLIQEFGKRSTRYLEFQGLPPREGLTTKDQLTGFAHQISQQTSLPVLQFDSWMQALSTLSTQLGKEKTVLLLDEISWLAASDKDFAGQLKVAWDTQLTKFPRLIVILCGSVSSWIDKNILNNTGFVGRLSLELTIKELSLFHCNQFWREKKDTVSSYEKLKMLSITGGVPRYLEEIIPDEAVEHTIKRLCFSKEGFLFSEFDQLFNDIFSNKVSYYKSILAALSTGSKNINSIADTTGRERSGYLSNCLNDLELSGFIRREPVFRFGSKKPSRLHIYRISDNYVRFYLKYIEPIKENIMRDLYEETPLDRIVKWDTIVGIQFESLVLNNLKIIFKLLKINNLTILSASPYFQRKTLRHQACQVDLLIQTTGTVYVCEIKCKKIIDATVVHQIREKIKRLKIPREFSIRTVLIYEGILSESLTAEPLLDRIISFSDMLNAQ